MLTHIYTREEALEAKKREFFREVEKLANESFDKYMEEIRMEDKVLEAYNKGRFHAFNTVLLMMGELE